MELGTYIGLRVQPFSVQRLTDFYSGYFDNLIPDMHLTLMYDRDTDLIHKYKNCCRPDRTYKATVTGIDVFGKPGDKWRALVLKLHCPQLTRRHAAIKKTFGFNHSYPTFEPHVSIKYQPSAQEERNFMRLKDIVGQKIEIAGEYVEPIRN